MKSKKLSDGISNWWLWRINLLCVVVLLEYNNIKAGFINAAFVLAFWLVLDYMIYKAIKRLT